MDYKLHLWLFLGLLITACQPSRNNFNSKALLKERDVNRIVLVGGGLISGMENHAYFETAMLQHYVGEEISFRNVGWPADDVFGMARSQFGSAQNTRSWQPPTAEEGFGSKVLMEHIQAAKPTTLMIGYGSETAFFKTDAEFELFKSGYHSLLEVVEGKEVKVVLVSPPKQFKYNSSVEELQKRNRWLERTHNFIKDLAEAKGYILVDLFNTLIDQPNEKT